MNDKYIKIIMTQTGIGGSFNALATFELDNIQNVISNVKIKMDTGCSISVIPLAAFNTDKEYLTALKQSDINGDIDYVVSYGVETGSSRPPKPESYEEKMASPALKFKHTIKNFSINGVQLNHKTIHINYDRTGNILIGMDIMKDWDIHISTVTNPDLEETGKTIFLACPKDSINAEYISELKRLFKIDLTNI